MCEYKIRLLSDRYPVRLVIIGARSQVGLQWRHVVAWATPPEQHRRIGGTLQVVVNAKVQTRVTGGEVAAVHAADHRVQIGEVARRIDQTEGAVARRMGSIPGVTRNERTPSGM
jgi:hypothetical protein